jgi:hypothetical protein
VTGSGSDLQRERTWSKRLCPRVNAAGNITARYRQASDTAGGVQTQSQSSIRCRIDLLPSVSNTLVPGSLRFTLAAQCMSIGPAAGARPSAATNSGSVAGTAITLRQWGGDAQRLCRWRRLGDQRSPA